MKGETGLHLFTYHVYKLSALHSLSVILTSQIVPFTGKVNPAFSSAVECITNFFQSSGFNLEICEDFHISLSRTVVLRHHWIEGFTSSIRKQLNGIQRFPVQIFSQNIDVYTNEEKTRTFIGMD